MPITIRCPWGGGVGGGVYHSQSNEALFMNVPGLVMVAPSTVRDAAGLLRSAIRSPDPVIYWENKKLYRSIREDLPEGEQVTTPIGEAHIAREGDAVTAVTFGYMLHVTLQAAERLGCVAVVTHHPLMDAALVQRLHASGRRALVYTANAPADVARLRAAGVDGIITDEVQRFADDARRGT